MTDAPRLDRKPQESYSLKVFDRTTLPATAAAQVSHTRGRRRRPPSPEEQKRREEWGARWGALVSQATAGLRKG